MDHADWIQTILTAVAVVAAVGPVLYSYYTDPTVPFWELWIRQWWGAVSLVYGIMGTTAGYSFILGYARKRQKKSVKHFEAKVHPKRLFRRGEEIEFVISFTGNLNAGYFDVKFIDSMGRGWFPLRNPAFHAELHGERSFVERKFGWIIPSDFPAGEYELEIGVYDTSKYLYRLLPEEPIQKVLDEIEIY